MIETRGFDFFMGVDPGKSGGIVVMDRTQVVLQFAIAKLTLHDLWGVFDQQVVVDLLWKNQARGQRRASIFAYVEHVHSWPAIVKPHRCTKCGQQDWIRQSQGAKSTFAFGVSFGQLQMALAAAEIPYLEMTPAKWQRKIGVPIKAKNETKVSHKNKMKALAQRYHPEVKMTLALSDATLLAELCKKEKG